MAVNAASIVRSLNRNQRHIDLGWRQKRKPSNPFSFSPVRSPRLASYVKQPFAPIREIRGKKLQTFLLKLGQDVW
jgi:hypothetical protein